jgi:GPH family glycoside/pentoside/hexuronide:cation symporter
VITLANFMTIFTQAIVSGAMFYMIDYVLPENSLNPIYFFFGGMIIGVILVNPLAIKWGYTRTQQLFFVIGGMGLILVSISTLSILIFICMFVAGFGIAGPLVITNVLFGQVADEDELNTGHRREGAFFGMNALITKPAQSLAMALPPFLLSFANFIPREENNGIILRGQESEALLMIRFIIGLIPGISLLLAALILYLYPMRNQEYLARVQSQLEELHEKKVIIQNGL